MIEIVESNDAESLKYIHGELATLGKRTELIEFQKLLGGENDHNHAIVSINAGAGGTESCDWVSMLVRMYKRWSDIRGFKSVEADILPGEEAGIKNITFFIRGPYAYGYLKGETGVHRLVRISPFDSNKRRHTSFASVEVIPEIDDDIQIDINAKDLKVDTFRAGGAGGQHVNMTDSAVRITHLPSGIVVQCQNERSQHKNKAQALKMLKSRLYKMKMDEKMQKEQKRYAEKENISWGNQIRSYVLHPYNMVKDHRTAYEDSDTQSILDGEIDAYLEAYLKWQAEKG